MEKKDFPALTGIRFIAASLVYVFHYAQILYTGKPLDFGYYLMRQMNVGVNLFFVLSGFLIAHRYYSLSLTRRGLWLYWCKRLFRIFPLYYAVLGFQLWMLYRQHHGLPDALTVFLNITLLKGLSDPYFFTVMTQSWSLTVEEMFYLYAPICFYLIKSKKIFWVQVPLLLAVGFAAVWVNANGNASFFGGVHFLFEGTFFGRCFEFFTGVYVALLLRNAAAERSGMRFTAGGGLAFCVLLLVQAFWAWAGKAESANGYSINVLLFHFLLPASLGALLYGLITEKSWLKNLLATDLATVLGKSSYAFYLLHIGALAEIFYFHVTGNLVLLYLLLQVCSIAAYAFFEKPVYFYLLRVFTKPALKTAL